MFVVEIILMRFDTHQLGLKIPSNLWYKSHFSRQLNSWSLRCSWSIACGGRSNYISILDLTPGDNRLDINNCKTRRKAFKCWDLMRLISDTLRYVLIYVKESQNVMIVQYPGLCVQPFDHCVEWIDVLMTWGHFPHYCPSRSRGSLISLDDHSLILNNILKEQSRFCWSDTHWQLCDVINGILVYHRIFWCGYTMICTDGDNEN